MLANWGFYLPTRDSISTRFQLRRRRVLHTVHGIRVRITRAAMPLLHHVANFRFSAWLKRQSSDVMSTDPTERRTELREKVVELGIDALDDQELLELLLSLMSKKADSTYAAQHLIGLFGSFVKVLTAPQLQLIDSRGVATDSAIILQIVRAAATRLALAELKEGPLIDNLAALERYLTIVMSREPVEHFRVLFLDTIGRLIADEAHARGTVDHVNVYPRQIFKRALELHASAMIFAHNHPSGDPTPFPHEIVMAREIRLAAKSLGILVCDHLIVGNGRFTSLWPEEIITD